MIQPADLFFTTSTSIFSKLVKFKTWSNWSHVQLIVDVEPRLSVVSADAEGVMYRDVREAEFKDYSILSCSSLTREQRRDILDFCFHQIGKGYDFLGLTDFILNADMQDEARWFCSELAFVAYQEKGIPLLKRIDHAFISPMHLYISPILDEVQSGKEAV